MLLQSSVNVRNFVASVKMQLFLREWREYLNVTQEELGARAMMDQTSISRIERSGKASYDSVKRIAKALDVKEYQLRHLPSWSEKGEKNHPSEVEPQRPTLESIGIRSTGEDVTEEEIDKLLATVSRLRARGTLTTEQIDEVARELMRDLILEERKRLKEGK